MPTANGCTRPPRSIGRRREDHIRARLAALVQSSADAIIGETRDGIITDWNPAAERLYGYMADEVIGQHRSLLIPPHEVRDVEAMATRVLGGEQINELETVRWTKDGQRIDVSLTVSPVWNDAGELVGTSIIVRDITARKATEQALASSEALLRTAVANAPIGMIVATPDLRVVRVNRALCEMLGYTEDELLASNFWHLTHPEDIEPNRTLMQRALAGEFETYALERRYVHKDGHVIWGHLHGSLARDEAGIPRYFVSQIQDITERMAADDVRGRLAAIVASAEDAVISSALDGAITSWNSGAQKLYGYRAEEILGQPFAVLLPDDLDDPRLAGRIAAVQAGEPSEPFETVRRRRDGTPVDVAISLSPIRDHAGQITGISSITRDVTARKQAEAALAAALTAAEEANLAKSHFLAMMSHELRTPLQAVLGYAEFLLANADGRFTAEEREDLGYIQQGGLRMLSLINQLLILSRLEAGRLEVARQPVDLPPVLEAVRQDVAPQAGQQGIDLVVALPSDLPPILGDAERLRQILLNLVGNAVKFTEHGAVEVTAQATEDDEVAIRVRDTGIGIAPEALPHVFEAFLQVDSRMARRHGGAGLGLAIAHKLAELMGGHITVESQLGDGSTFTLNVPVASLRQR
jgi:PAS domain S-box-containing protein